MYKAGDLSETEYENLRAYLEGKRWEIPKELDEALKKYISGTLSMNGLKLIIKVSAGDVKCGNEKEVSPEDVAILKLKATNELALGAEIYVDGKEDYVFEIDAQAYEIYEKEIEAEAAKRKVKIESVLEGAEVYVGGRYEGETPLEVELEVGKEHEIKLVKPRYYELKRKIFIPSKGGKITRRYTLKEAPPGVLKI